jgi:hypothetical protein
LSFITSIWIYELVYGAKNRPKRALPSTTSYGSSSGKGQLAAKEVVPVETEEEKRKKLRMQQQAAFQREASRRMSVVPGVKVAGANGANSDQNAAARVSISSAVSPVVPPAAPVTPNGGVDNFERDNIQRQQRLSRYGNMTVVTPTPGFVLKTKRNTGTKVFINICSHNAVPFKPEENAKANDVDENKLIYMLVGQPFEYQNEKDGSYCIIYDVIVHPDEVFASSINPTGTARNRVSSPRPLLLFHFWSNCNLLSLSCAHRHST